VRYRFVVRGIASRVLDAREEQKLQSSKPELRIASTSLRREDPAHELRRREAKAEDKSRRTGR